MLCIDPVQLPDALLNDLIFLFVIGCLRRKQMFVVMRHDTFLEEIQGLRLHLRRSVRERQLFGFHKVSEASVAVLYQLRYAVDR